MRRSTLVMCDACWIIDHILWFNFQQKQVWDRIAPGLASQFDAPYTIPTIAPRPLLILNGMSCSALRQPVQTRLLS